MAINRALVNVLGEEAVGWVLWLHLYWDRLALFPIANVFNKLPLLTEIQVCPLNARISTIA